MDIAIHLEKIDLGSDRYLFKPIGVVRGKYYKEQEFFETEFGVVCDSIDSGNIDAIDFFDSPTTMEELKEYFGDNVPEDMLLTEYLSISIDNCYIGIYNFEEGEFIVKKIPFDDIENYSENETVDINDEGYGTRFVFGLDDIKNFVDKKPEEIKQILLGLIKTSEELIAKYKNGEYKQDEVVEGTIEEPKKKLKLKREESKKFDLVGLRREVLSNIIGQDEAVNDVTRTLAINYTSINSKNKDHILIAGPSGTGKTELVKIVANRLGVPVFKADATAYTKSGYQGKEVNSMLAGLILAANGDLKKAQKGILVIDEIDKKSSNSKDDVSGKAVLHSLLKIMDRDVIEVDLDHANSVMFDTSDLTIILMGSFDELYKEKQKYKKNPIGFSNTEKEDSQKVRLNEDDFIKWLGPEFLGRIGLVTSTEELKLEDVIKILRKSKISQLRIVEEDLANRGVKLTYTSEYIKEIAKKGSSKETGVRKLNKAVKDNLKYAYEEIMTRDDVKVLKLSKATALDPKKYFLG